MTSTRAGSVENRAWTEAQPAMRPVRKVASLASPEKTAAVMPVGIVNCISVPPANQATPAPAGERNWSMPESSEPYGSARLRPRESS